MKSKSTKSLTKLRVVIDTNVFVSGFIWGGVPRKVIDKWLEEKFSLLLSPFLLSEIILTFERFDWSRSDLDRLQEILEMHSIKVVPKRVAKICRDDKDNQILDLCRGGKADYLVTGDEDLLVLSEYIVTKIVAAREFTGIVNRL